MQYKQLLLLGAALFFSNGINAEWKYNTEVFFAASDDASITGIRWLQPWWQDGKSLVFSDARFLGSDHQTEEFNAGGGYRRLVQDETAILGGYGFLDYRSSSTNRKFSQLTLGGEYLLDKWEIRANIYSPLKDEYILDTLRPVTSTRDSFIGNTVTRVTTTVPGGLAVEEALQGYDVEVGYLLPGSEDFEIRANLGLYQFSAPVAGSTQGLRARIEAFPRENFKVSYSIESDELFKTRSFLELSFPLGRKIGRPGKRSLYKRMTQFAYRDIDIRETSRLGIDKRTKNGPGTTQAAANTQAETSTPEVGIAHIDSSKSVADADGSIERPYNSIADCKAATTKTFSCASGARTIYLHANPSNSVNGVAQHYIGNITLAENQKLVGDGVTTGFFADLSSKVSPILLGNGLIPSASTTPVVTMGSNNAVQGVQIGWSFQQTLPGADVATNAPLPSDTAVPEIAIRASNSKGGVISDTVITGSQSSPNNGNNFSTGIHFYADGSTNDNSLLLNNVNINATLGDAVHVEANQTTTNSLEQIFTMRNSIIEKNGRGIHASADGIDDGNIEQSIIIESENPTSDTLVNQIKFNFNEGVLVENLKSSNTSSTFTAVQNLTVKNSLIQSNQGAGIQTLLGQTGVDAEGTPQVSTVTLDNVNLNLNDGSGLVLDSQSAKLEASLSNVFLSANLLPTTARSGGNKFGLRLDLVAIDCGDATACAAAPANVANASRDSSNFRRTGYGIYAKNRDSSSTAEGTQSITISENFTNTLHDSGGAQIFLDSQGLSKAGSTQTITLTPVSEEPKKIKDPSTSFERDFFDTRAGQAVIQSGNIVVGQLGGASTPKIAFCDDGAVSPATPNTLNDGKSPHILPYGGELSGIALKEICP